jgi:predicted membrane protein
MLKPASLLALVVLLAGALVFAGTHDSLTSAAKILAAILSALVIMLFVLVAMMRGSVR